MSQSEPNGSTVLRLIYHALEAREVGEPLGEWGGVAASFATISKVFTF